MAQCETIPVETLYETDTTSSWTTTTTLAFPVTTAPASTSEITATVCVTEVEVGSTCVDWTASVSTSTISIETITVPLVITNSHATSTRFTTTCPDNPNPPDNPTSSTSTSSTSSSNNNNNNNNNNGNNGNNGNNNNNGGGQSTPSSTSTPLTTGSSSSSSAATPGSTASLPTGTPRLNEGAGGGDTAAAKAGRTVGIVLGSVLGAAVLGTVLFWFWRRRISNWNDIFDDSDDEGTGRHAGRGWKAVGGAPMMLRHRRTRRKPRVDLDPTPGPYEYGLVGSDRSMTTPTAAVGLVTAAAPSGHSHERSTSQASPPGTPSSYGPVVRPASAMALAHARAPSSPDGFFSLPPGAAAPLIDIETTPQGITTAYSARPSNASGQSRSGSPVSMDMGVIGAVWSPQRRDSTMTRTTTASGVVVPPPLSAISPLERDFGTLGIRPMSTSTVSTVMTTARPAGGHERGPSFGSNALSALDEIVAGQVAGQQSPQPSSPRVLKLSSASSSPPSPPARTGTGSPTGLIIHKDAGPVPQDHPAFAR
ncbi:hypothetical protein BKA62DRAFT_136256 [Auriculariales sp. MPI-PUGE-AT-0066]|nr:hypothetical protein BKA62DRAFT_136256 [Auriculariales sp. MPI-PUGE-AT-0066]